MVGDLLISYLYRWIRVSYNDHANACSLQSTDTLPLLRRSPNPISIEQLLVLVSPTGVPDPKLFIEIQDKI